MPRTGATFGSEFEWREAARFALVTWDQFKELDGEEQSAIVAHFRTHNQVEAVIAQAQTKEAKRRNHRGRRGG